MIRFCCVFDLHKCKMKSKTKLRYKILTLTNQKKLKEKMMMKILQGRLMGSLDARYQQCFVLGDWVGGSTGEHLVGRRMDLH
jgi:hypothetical protein